MGDIVKSALTDACTIKLENFEGPFDLLFYLIEKNQIDIYDIPINIITEQYLDYLNAMQELDLEIASEFLVMAATLLHIKSRMLLPEKEPTEEEAADPREELIIRLLEYKKYKEYAKVLGEREVKWSKAHYKLPEAIPAVSPENEIEVSPAILRSYMLELLKKYREKRADVTGRMQKILNREKVSLKAKVREILELLGQGIRICFSKVFSIRKKSRLEVATGFLAMLEITKAGYAAIEQPVPFGEIYITPGRKNDDTDPMPIIEDDM
ncbi:MAG TPA: segregation/condensation protein A [Clostridiaceae bacterium]|nr:segregation/condensation protein A [Clostridiaceae bacterium]